MKTKGYSLRQRINRTEAIYHALCEASYEGNLGAVEVAQFYMNADDIQIQEFEEELDSGNETEAWDIIQRFHGVDLVGIGSDMTSPRAEMVAGQIDEYFNKSKEVLTYELLYEMVAGIVREDEKGFIIGGKDDPEPAVLSDGAEVSIVAAAKSAASPAEAMEMALVYGILNASKIGSRGVSVDESWFSALRKRKALSKMTAEGFAVGIRIGVKIATAGGVSRAQIFGQSATDKAREGMNSTPKTDILIEGMQVSVKDYDAGFQAEAVEQDTFKPLFDFALGKFMSDFKGTEGKEYLDTLDGDGVVEIFKGVLTDYRTNPEGHGQEINNLLGLKGAAEDSESTREDDKETIRKFVSEKTTIDAYNQLIDSMVSLFKDPDFKKEFVWQAVTGEYKFEDTDAGRAKSVATHMLYFSPKQGGFSVKKLMNDDGSPTKYLDEMAEKFTWQIRTGRRKAAPAESGVRYQGAGVARTQASIEKKLFKVAEYVNEMVDDVTVKGTTEMRSLINKHYNERYDSDAGIFMDLDPRSTDTDQHGYEFLRALATWVTSKTYTQGMGDNTWDTAQGFFDHMFGKWEGKEVVVKNDDGRLVFKGRSGRMATDVGAGKDDLDNQFSEALLEEGWMGDAWNKVKQLAADGIEKVQSWLGVAKSKLLDFLGFEIGTQVIEHPEVSLDNSFEK